METPIDFGELASDENFKKKILDLRKSMNDVSATLEKFFSLSDYDELSLEDKVRYDLFVAFAINTYFWIYLRIKGIDPNNHEIKHQINKVKEYMNKSKKIYEKKTLMPKLDQAAAKRFVRSGLWNPNASGEPSVSTEGEVGRRKKRKREDDDCAEV